MGCFSGGKGLAVEKRQAPVIEVTMAGTTPPPRSKEGTHPGRFSHVRNAGTPTESGPLRRPGRPTVRNGGILLAGTGCPRSECRWAKADRKPQRWWLLLQAAVAGNWPDTGVEVLGPRKGR